MVRVIDEIPGPQDGGGYGCQNCAEPFVFELEVSKLVQSWGELVETPLVSFVYLCESCVDALARGDWGTLTRRNVREPISEHKPGGAGAAVGT